MKFVIYNKTTGEIKSYSETSTNTPIFCDDDGFLIIDEYVYTHLSYVDTKLLIIKDRSLIPYTIDKTTIVADGIDTLTITLPSVEPNGNSIPTYTFKHNKKKYISNDNVIEFSTVDVGVHTFEFKVLNYLNTIVEVTAV